LNCQIELAEMQQQLSNLHIQNWQAEFTDVGKKGSVFD
jgi:hypothetical protein